MDINRKTPGKYVHSWWNDNDKSHLNSMKFLNNPVSFNNIDAIVAQKLAIPFTNVSLLDIGFGRSHYAGHERSDDLETIEIHFSGAFNDASSFTELSDTLTVKQYIGCGEELPIESNSFDFICCGDIAVNFMDFGTMIRELSRVLKKDGIFFYDAVNRTSISQLIIIKILRELRSIAIPDSLVPGSDGLIQTKDLLKLLDEHYLFNQGQCSDSNTNFVFHYYNLRDKIPEVFIEAPRSKLRGMRSPACSIEVF